MDTAATTGIFTLAGALGGTLIGSVTTVLVQWAGNRRTARTQAADLLARVANSATAVQTELAMYRQRRDSKRSNGLALGQVLLEIGAARMQGNWLRGAADGVRELRTWDHTEAARFHGRFATAASDMNPALVHLSLTSSELQQAAAGVTNALTALMKARKPDEIDAAGNALAEAVGSVRRAVEAFIAPKMVEKKAPASADHRARRG